MDVEGNRRNSRYYYRTLLNYLNRDQGILQTVGISAEIRSVKLLSAMQ